MTVKLSTVLKRQKMRSRRARGVDAAQTSRKVVQPTDKKGLARWLKTGGRRVDVRGIDTAGAGRAPARAKRSTARAKTTTCKATGSPIRAMVSRITSDKQKRRAKAYQAYMKAGGNLGFEYATGIVSAGRSLTPAQRSYAKRLYRSELGREVVRMLRNP